MITDTSSLEEMLELPSCLEGMLKLPDCPPASVLPKDLHDHINGKPVAKYYTSDLLDIKNNNISSDLFHTEPMPELLQERAKMIKNVMGLLDGNDVCDKAGILFLSNVYTTACSSSSAIGEYLCKGLNQSSSSVALLAIKYAELNKK